MRFLVDTNAGGSVARWLAEEGHDVVCVSDRDPKMKDHDILRWANREMRIVVTTDQDFEEMIWREGEIHCGVLRLENLPRRERKELLKYVLAYHGQDLELGAIIVASSKKIRIRNP